MIDYQIQTTASDGKFSPRECVKMAKENGLVSISITDHDTAEGIREALKAGEEFGVEVIPGIEISADHENNTIHILGFGLDYKHADLLSELERIKRERETRGEKIIKKLQELGYEIDYEKVRARAGNVVARPHIVEELLSNPKTARKLQREGIEGHSDIYERLIGDKGAAFVRHVMITARRAIDLIHEAKGIAVWSHPTVPMSDHRLVEKTLQIFLQHGMEGIEAIGSYFTKEDTSFLHMLASKYNLIRTAGSDFHDVFIREKDPELGSTAIGSFKPFGYPIEGIRETLLAAIEKRHATTVAPPSSF